jgi:esterase/lipase superfamily enzyme
MQFAAMRAAQVKHDIQFPGSVVLFCWPSQGTLQGYRQDERLSAASVDQFVEFMNLLLSSQSTSSNPGRIHLLAHSMGNRILLEGLASLQSGNRIPQNAIGHIVMAAPDVDHSQFLLNFPKVAQSAGSVTMYFCRDDKALLASQAVHVDSRIGQKLVPYDPLINIDAAQANTSFLGHDYFAARNPLLVDLQMHLVMGYGPDRRPTIRPATISGFQYWKFP